MDLTLFITILIAGLLTGGMYSLIAVNFNFQLGALRVVNFSYGASLMLAMYLVFALSALKLPFLATLGLVIVLLLPCYFLVGWLLRRYVVFTELDDVQILLTMGLAIFIENMAQAIWGAFPRTLGAMEKGMLLGDIYINVTRLQVFLVSLILLAVGYLFLTRTWFGRCIRAVVQNKEMASVVGVNARRVAVVAFAISYCFLVIGAYLLMMFYSVEPHTGGSFLTMAFLICVLGGIGNLAGSFAASFIIGIISAFVSFFLPGYHDPILFSAFILLILLRPSGLFGEA